jgi:carbon-monoxide dehydrogenase medium subunit
MIPVAFDYERATSIEDAIAKLGASNGGKLIAGGHSLVPLMKLRLSEPGKLVDISKIPGLSGIKDAAGASRLARRRRIPRSRLQSCCATRAR